MFLYKWPLYDLFWPFFCHSFFPHNVTSKLGVFNIFKANKINIKCTLQKRNFKVLVFKSRRSFWGHAWCHKKNILLTFKGFCMNFSLELKKIILSHPVTSKQPHKIVQILMRHPVNLYAHFIFSRISWIYSKCYLTYGIVP